MCHANNFLMKMLDFILCTKTKEENGKMYDGKVSETKEENGKMYDGKVFCNSFYILGNVFSFANVGIFRSFKDSG